MARRAPPRKVKYFEPVRDGGKRFFVLAGDDPLTHSAERHPDHSVAKAR